MNIIEKFEKLENDFADSRDLGQIKAWKKEVMKKLRMDACNKMEGIKDLKKQLRAYIISINNKLVDTDNRLSDDIRDRLLDKKEVYYWFLNFFEPVNEEYLREIEQKVNENLNNNE